MSSFVRGDAYGRQARDGGSTDRPPRNTRSSRAWIIVALLLLMLLSCVLVQLFMPGRRGPIVALPAEGLVPIFSIYGLNEPRAVSAGPDGRMVVSDTGAQRAYLYDSNGVLLRRLGGELPENRVFSVAGSLYEDGVIYLCDWGLKRVWIFAEDGSVLGYFPDDPVEHAYGLGGFFPYDIDRIEEDFLVSTRTGVFRFDDAGALIGRFDEDDAGGIAPNHMTGIEVDPLGQYVWVVDSLNRRLIAYDVRGNPVWSLGRPDEDGQIVSFFGLPRDVVYTPMGILVSDAFRHEIYLFDRGGTLIGVYGARGTADGEFNFPEAVSLAPDGLLCVADRANDRIQVLRLGAPLAPSAELMQKWEEGITRHD